MFLSVLLRITLQVYMDSNGDAEGNYTLIAMQDDYNYPGKKLTMQPVGHFIYNATNTAVPVSEHKFIYQTLLYLFNGFSYRSSAT